MACQKQVEYREVNGRNGTGVSVVAVGGQTKIFHNPGGQVKILEISMQPESDAHLQLFEAGGAGINSGIPMTAQRFVQATLLWSTPGKQVQNDVYLVIQEPGVIVDVDVRYIIE